MFRTYETYEGPVRNEKTEALAEKLVELIVSSWVTYSEARSALELMEEMLATRTKPVSV